jgi:hypothetical protein
MSKQWGKKVFFEETPLGRMLHSPEFWSVLMSLIIIVIVLVTR